MDQLQNKWLVIIEDHGVPAKCDIGIALFSQGESLAFKGQLAPTW